MVMGAKRLPNGANDEGGPWFVSGNGLGWCPSDSRVISSDFGRSEPVKIQTEPGRSCQIDPDCRLVPYPVRGFILVLHLHIHEYLAL